MGLRWLSIWLLLASRRLRILFLIDSENFVLNLDSFGNQPLKEEVPHPEVFFMLDLKCLHIFLGSQIGSVTLFKVVIDSLQPFLVLLDAWRHLLLLGSEILEDSWVVDLFAVFPLLRQVLLNVDQLGVLVPLELTLMLTISHTWFYKGVADILHSDSSHYALHLGGLLDPIPSQLEDLQSLGHISVPFQCLFDFGIYSLDTFLWCLELSTQSVNRILCLLQKLLQLLLIVQEVLYLLFSQFQLDLYLPQIKACLLELWVLLIPRANHRDRISDALELVKHPRVEADAWHVHILLHVARPAKCRGWRWVLP